MTAENISFVRLTMFGLTGLTCLIYAGLAMINGQPAPFHPAIPSAMGIVSLAILLVAGIAAGGKNAKVAWDDEGFKSDAARAAQIGYWIALLIYPAFTSLVLFEIVEINAAVPAMATLTAAAFLISFALLDIRGRL